MAVLKKLSALARLTRVEHSFMLAIAVLIAILVSTHQPAVTGSGFYAFITPYSLCYHHAPPGCLAFFPASDLSMLLFPWILWLLPPFFISLGAFALNDYLDLKSDKINKRNDRPLVTGDLSPKTALMASALCFALGLFFALGDAPSSLPLAICVLFTLLAIAYDFKLKDLPLAGNIYIATTMAIPFIYGALLVSIGLSYLALSLAAVAFLAGLGREIMKSTEDMEGDKKARGSKTLPILIGARNASLIAGALFLLTAIASVLPFAFGMKQAPIPLAVVSAASLLFLYMGASLILSSPKKEQLKNFRKLSLAALSLGLLGYLLAALL